MTVSYGVERGPIARGGLAAVVVLSLALVGCTSNPVAPAPSTPASASAPAETPGTTPSATPTTPAGIPVTIPCDSLVTPDQLYAFNANYGVNPQYVVEPGSAAAQIVALQGISCGWLNQTSNQTIEVALAHLEPADIEDRKNQLVISSHVVPTYNDVADEGYFTTDGTIGRADVFVGDYWLMLRSSEFFEPGDAIALVDPVAGNIAALG